MTLTYIPVSCLFGWHCWHAFQPPSYWKDIVNIYFSLIGCMTLTCFQSLDHRGDIDISRVSDQKGMSLLYIMLEIHHSGWEPSICSSLLSVGMTWLICSLLAIGMTMQTYIPVLFLLGWHWHIFQSLVIGWHHQYTFQSHVYLDYCHGNGGLGETHISVQLFYVQHLTVVNMIYQ